ncbi:MAG: PQQ-dependent sugar dehydrogenase [Anaerolineales bacterium]
MNLLKRPVAPPQNQGLILYILAISGILALAVVIPNQLVLGQPARAPAAFPGISFKVLASGLQAPDYVTHAGDNSGRIFIVEQAGVVRIVHNGNLLTKPFLDISDRVQFYREEGLLSLAFPPDYAQKGYFNVYYTRRGETNNQVSRFHLTNDPNVANPNSEEQILLLNHPGYANHNGGLLVFGPDGYLYIGTGDGGGGGDPNGNAQNPGSLLGKLLRIDTEYAWGNEAIGENLLYLPILLSSVQASSAPTYKIPADNPFVGHSGARPEIWALGLRNPWRYSFDRQTHDLYIADVGQNTWEEVDFQPASSQGGANYGWNIWEGNHCYSASTCVEPANYSPPVAEYDHSFGCSITGGYVYRGAAHPAMQGTYFYGDYCSARIWGLQFNGSRWLSEELKSAPGRITSFGEDQAGELYLTSSNGVIYQVVSP